MSDGRKPRFKEPIDPPQMKVELEGESKAPLSPEQLYLKRQAEVAQQDNQDFRLSAKKSGARSGAAGASHAGCVRPAAARQETQSQEPAHVGRRHRGGRRGGHIRLSDAHRSGYPGSGGEARRRNLYRAAASSDRSRIGQSSGRRGRPALRRLGSLDADQDERRHLRREPQHRQVARLDLILELRRLQSDLASPLRVSERGSRQRVRMDQQHARRQEFPDLRHSNSRGDSR